MMRRLSLAVAAMFVATAPVHAKTWPEFRQVEAKESFAPKIDRAYVLVRVRRSSIAWLAPAFLRVPRADEIVAFNRAKKAEYERKKRDVSFADFPFEDPKFNNFYGLDLGKRLAEQETTRTFLLELEPADYIVAGVGNRIAMWTCFCQGSVLIRAEAGKIADAGTILLEPADRAVADPELQGVTNLGAMAKMDFLMFAGAIRPYRPGDARPALPASIPVVPAQFHASAPFVLQGAALANFLAPLPGVLDYRRGEVFDVKAGTILQPR